ncbi:MAG TPA: hypothetical protein VHZ95_17155 [Polyangiales bacterium]|jgi:hypothetical protein|nr:hypothetical protein [Polyangiales bacterium]
MNLHPRLLAAAVGGLLLGATGCASSSPAAKSAEPTATAGGENHGCKSANECKGQGERLSDNHSCKGMNECKAQGGCHTDNHSCKGLNDCKGQGGCKAS